MAHELKPLDISDTPELLRLAREVQSTRTPRVLVRDSEELAVLVPVIPTSTSRQRRRAKTPTVALESLRGAAGSLKQPLPWHEMLEVARADRVTQMLSDGQ